MSYTTINFKTKKAMKSAVDEGQEVGVFQPGPFGKGLEAAGKFTLEGPHYPKPHRWYARVQVENGKITKVIS